MEPEGEIAAGRRPPGEGAPSQEAGAEEREAIHHLLRPRPNHQTCLQPELRAQGGDRVRRKETAVEASQAPLKVPRPQTRVRRTVSSAGHVPTEAKHAGLRPRQMLMPRQEQTLVTARQ